MRGCRQELFHVLGDPVAQGRPKFRRYKKKGEVYPTHVMTYDPEKSASWKERVIAQVTRQIINRGDFRPFDGPIELFALFVLPRPKSIPRKVVYHVKRPDCDNLVKGLKDAMGKGLVYKDDASIVQTHIYKAYSGDGRTGVAIMIREDLSDIPDFLLHEFMIYE